MVSANPIEEQLTQLYESFAARLPSRVEEIERAWDAAVCNAWSEERASPFSDWRTRLPAPVRRLALRNSAKSPARWKNSPSA